VHAIDNDFRNNNTSMPYTLPCRDVDAADEEDVPLPNNVLAKDDEVGVVVVVEGELVLKLRLPSTSRPNAAVR